MAVRIVERAGSSRVHTKTGKVRIKSVSFRSSVELKPYQHAHIEASADVPMGQDPETVLTELKVFVAHQLGIAKFGDAEVIAKTGRFQELITQR